MPTSKKVLVLGAGISGLTTAARLKEHGCAVSILEKGSRCGGAIQTLERDGYKVELGPNTVQSTSQKTQEFLSRGVLKNEVVQPSENAAKRFLVRYGRPIAAPASPMDGIRSSLFSLKGKLRLASEIFIPAKKDGQDESLADFAKRRVGKEFLDYALNPMVAGVYAGDPEKLSVQHAFPKVHRLEAQHGGLIRGGLKVRKEKKARGDTYKTKLLSYKDGLETLPKALAQALEGHLYLSSQLRSIERENKHFKAEWLDCHGSMQNGIFSHIVLCVPPSEHPHLPLPSEVSEALLPLQAILYPPLASVALGFRGDQVPHALDGFGMLIPEKEKKQVLGTLFSSSLFEGRAPQDHVLLTSFVGGMRQPELAQLPEAQLIETVRADLRDLLGIFNEPTFTQVTVWPRSIPQYTVGYQRMMDAMLAAEKTCDGLLLGGNYRDGISVEKCILAALDRADAIAGA